MAAPSTPPLAPGALPLAGHLGRLARHPLEFFEELRERGPVTRIRLGRRPVYVVSAPDLVQHLLVGGRADFDKGGPFLRPLIELTGNGLASSPHGVHRAQRPLIQPAFRPTRLPTYVERMVGYAAPRVRAWRPGQVLDVDREMSALATGALSRSLFTDPVSVRAIDVFQHDLRLVIHGLARQMTVPRLARLPLPANRRFRDAVRRTDAAIDGMVGHRRARRADSHDDLLTLLLAPEPHERGTLTDDLVRGHVWTFLLGGIETTSSITGWTLRTLFRRPEHHARVQEEIDTTLRGAPPTHATLPRLDHLNRTLTEVARLHPPAWLGSRTAVRPTELGGYRIPQGADVFYSPHALHRAPAVFPDPDRFEPDRWRRGSVTREMRESYLPFGAGPRKCIGDAFGMAEAAATLALLFQSWRVHPAPGSRGTPQVRFTQRVQGLRMVVRPHPPRTARRPRSPAGPSRTTQATPAMPATPATRKASDDPDDPT